MMAHRDSGRSGLVAKLSNFGRKAAGAAVVAGALYGGLSSQTKAETMTYSGSSITQANADAHEYFQYGVSSSDPDVGGFAVVAFNADYDNTEIKLGLDEYDFPVDTSIYPIDRFWVSYLALENESGEEQKIWSNYTPSLQVGDKLTGKLSIENRAGGSTYAPLSLDVLDFDLSANTNGVTDILISYEVDTNLSYEPLTGSILASDAIENHGGNIATWQQLCHPDFDHRCGDCFGTLTFEAVGDVPEASNLVLLVSAGIAGMGLACRRKRIK